jgi:very-short-patch-repair endonuclease
MQLTKEQIIKRFKITHGDFYNYTKADYVNIKEKVIIICPIHGEFEQTPDHHYRGNICPKCSIEKRLAKTIEKRFNSFKEKANEKYNFKYDYSKFEYENNTKISTIICPIHGEFKTSPSAHLNLSACPKCSRIKRSKNSLKDRFKNSIKKANKKHNFKYDYSKFKYINQQNKSIIICPIHGEFEQCIADHMNGEGCSKCSIEKMKKSKTYKFEDFYKVALEKHGDKYRYLRETFISYKHPIKIICPIHGEFKQLAKIHANGNGCPKCAIELTANQNRLNEEEYINKVTYTHNNRYDYSKVNYKGSNYSIIIICPIHGEFKQNANDHKRGRGCPKCKLSKGEDNINRILSLKNIKFYSQKKFKNSKILSKWQSFDFYLPKYKLLIEYQGEQHYKPCKIFGGEKRFITQLESDSKKELFAKVNNYHLLEIPYTIKKKSDIEKVILEKIRTIKKTYKPNTLF